MGTEKKIQNIREAVEAKKKELLKEFGEKAPDGGSSGGGDGLNRDFIRKCLDANQLGDGILYAKVNKGKFICNTLPRQPEWWKWNGQVWVRDNGQEALAAVENVCQAYIREADQIHAELSSGKVDDDTAKQLRSLENKIWKRVYALRGDTRRNACLKFAYTNPVNPLTVDGTIFDTRPWDLACTNAIIMLKTGEIRQGRQNDYITKASPVEWRGLSEPAPLWESFLFQIFEGHEDIVPYLQRLFGYALVGMVKEHVLPILWGKGRNGKGTLVETICAVLGPLAGPIQSEMLLDQGRTRSSAGPSPDIMSLKGMRMVFASETDEGRKFSHSRVKWLSGGDTLVGRFPHDREETRFQPTHTLFLLTNNKPHANPNDFAFWERVHLIPFKYSFVDRTPVAEDERRADKDLPEKLKAEYPGILAWLVRGCLEWQEKGLDPPEIIREATEEFRRDEDVLGDFIEECCLVDPQAEVQSSTLYDAFAEWFETNISKKVWSARRFGKLMKERFERYKKGVYFYKGIRLLSGL